jgi:hypothetical protein
MRDFALLVSERQYLLGETDIPDIYYESGVYIKVTEHGITISWNNSNTIGENVYGRQDFEVQIKKTAIISIKSFPKQDIQEGDNSWSTNHYPELVINHKDPYEVVDFFTTKLRHSESYWVKALSKYLSQELDIKIEQE